MGWIGSVRYGETASENKINPTFGLSVLCPSRNPFNKSSNGPLQRVSPSRYLHGPNEVPYPAAFEHAKKFLKQMLHSLSDAGDEFILNMGALVVLRELIRQLKIYVRREGPFGSPPSSATLPWWRALSESYDANVLAVSHYPQILKPQTYILASVSCNPHLLGLC